MAPPEIKSYGHTLALPDALPSCRSALGALPYGTLDEARRAETGRMLAEHMTQCGGDPGTVRSGRPSLTPRELAAYLALHIEPEPVLEELQIPLGDVTGLRGNLRFTAQSGRCEYSYCVGVPPSHRGNAAIAIHDQEAGLDRSW